MNEYRYIFVLLALIIALPSETFRTRVLDLAREMHDVKHVLGEAVLLEIRIALVVLHEHGHERLIGGAREAALFVEQQHHAHLVLAESVATQNCIVKKSSVKYSESP